MQRHNRIVAGDPAQARVLVAQVLEQAEQRTDLRGGVGLGHGLVPRIIPVGIAPDVHQLDADRTRVEPEGVMGHAQIADETQGAAIAVDVIVAAVAGLAVRMANALAVFTCRRQIRQLVAMDDDEIDRRS